MNRSDKIVKSVKQREGDEGDGAMIGVEGMRIEKSTLGFKCCSSFKHYLPGLFDDSWTHCH